MRKPDTTVAVPDNNTETRYCVACLAEKPVDDFAWHNKGVKRKSRCRPCQAAYDREWRIAHPELWQKAYKESQARCRSGWRTNLWVTDKLSIVRGEAPTLRPEDHVVWLWKRKSETPCSDCHETYHPAAIDFDHLRDKHISISSIVRIKDLVKLLQELEKCEIVCACCHRIRTKERSQYIAKSPGSGKRVSRIVVVEITDGGKVCTDCQKRLREEDFSWKNQAVDKRLNRCRKCMADYQHDWHISGGQERLIRARESLARRRSAAREFVDGLKARTPCADCGRKKDPIAVDFDHLDDTKEHTISAMVRAGYLVSSIQAEIDKCEIVCANCHRVRTYNRKLESKGLIKSGLGGLLFSQQPMGQ